MGGSFWKILLVVGTVLEVGTSASRQEPLWLEDKDFECLKLMDILRGGGRGPMSYENVVMTAVENYNIRHWKETPALLLKHERPPQWDRVSDQKQMFNFTLKEVVCGNGKCNFKENGKILDCVGSYLMTEDPRVPTPTCNEVEDSSATEDGS